MNMKRDNIDIEKEKLLEIKINRINGKKGYTLAELIIAMDKVLKK